MELNEIGEREIIRRISEIYDTLPCVKVGIGHDAAVIELDPESKQLLVVKVDRGPRPLAHILGKTDMKLVGRFLVVVNVSDIAAAGANPLGMAVFMGLPPTMVIGEIEDLATGINESIREYGACVFGGDTKESKEFILVGATIGTVSRDEFLTRAGARVGDIVSITGNIGTFMAGACALRKKLDIDQKTKDTLLGPILRPKAALREARIIASLKAATASMDDSDGLSGTLHTIAEKSGVGMEIYEENLPILDEVKIVANLVGFSSSKFAFGIGGDWGIVFTIKRDKFDIVQQSIQKAGGKITNIGKVINEKKIYLISPKGERRQLKKFEHEQFRISPLMDAISLWEMTELLE